VSPEKPRRFRFGAFELDSRTGELQHEGVIVRLQEQPLETLLTLIEHAGRLVTREQIHRRLWRDDFTLDGDRALNAIVKRLRDLLNDPADNPVFIQTVPHRGYQFLAPVEVLPAEASDDLPSFANGGAIAADRREQTGEVARAVRENRTLRVAMMLIAVTTSAVVLGIVLFMHRPGARRETSLAGRQARLAVLPFENFTDDDQFFADGLHEEMIVRLGRLQPRRLAVIARTSVLPYRGASKSIRTIARELGVDYVLEGSVRRAGERFRITAQLIRADSQSQLWTETYDRSWNDIFAIQTDVGARVADSLAVELVPQYVAAENGDRTVSPQAYEHYLRGRFYWNQRTRDPSSQLAHAIEQFQMAVAEQPDYAPAYAGLADAYNSVFFASPGFAEEVPSNARRAIERALRLDARLASAHSTLAWMTLHFDHDPTLAEKRFRRALELDPNDSLARFRLSHVLAARGRLDEAEREAATARRYDPLSAPIADILAWYRYYEGANADALRRMGEAADLEGNPLKLRVFAAYLEAVNGNCRANTELGVPPLPPETLRLGEVAFVTARCGTAPAADSLFRELTARRLAYPVAMLQFGRGQLDAFYDWLNRAIDERFPEPLYIGVDPVFSRERQSPRFQAAMRRLGL
jgi:TolB-like protein/DNA-binding winged helix-turn-helix (wHTH) protein